MLHALYSSVCDPVSPSRLINYLVEVEDQVQLTHIAEVVVKYLHKQVDTFQVGKLIVCDVNTHGKEQTRIPPVYHFVRLELHKFQASQ